MLLVTILTIVVSLSAVVYAAAMTNPGHGVEEIGSGSSPYAPFRDWNAFESGYEDQYSGPSGLKSNVFWLATLNAETLAAQNSSGDWCALQVHPSGIYMNCFNNNSNMSLYNSYYWNGTNFTKNDTIKKDDDWVEKTIIGAGANGGELFQGFQNPATGDKNEQSSTPTGTTFTTTDGVSSSTGSISQSNTATGHTVEISAGDDAGGGAGSTVTVNEGEIKDTTSDAGGNTGTTTLTPTGKTDKVEDGAGNVGKFELENDEIAATIEVGGTKWSSSSLGTDANGGTSTTEITSVAGVSVGFTEQFVDGVGAGQSRTTTYGPTGAGDDAVIITQEGQEAATTDPDFSIVLFDSVSGADIFTMNLEGDNTGAGKGSFIAVDATAGTYGMDADGTAGTSTITGGVTSIGLNNGADTITITAGTTKDENTNDFLVEIDNYVEVVDASGGFSVAIPAGATSCTLAGIYTNAPDCFLHDFDFEITAPGFITGSFKNVVGAGCSGAAAFNCKATT